MQREISITAGCKIHEKIEHNLNPMISLPVTDHLPIRTKNHVESELLEAPIQTVLDPWDRDLTLVFYVLLRQPSHSEENYHQQSTTTAWSVV
jgi:hypothetical protein